MKNKYSWVTAIAVLVIALDQFTKQLIMTRFLLGETVTVIPGFFNVTSVRNRGAAFGFLAGAQGAWRTFFFIIIAIVAMAVIAVLIRKAQDRLLVVALALIGGGAVGNLIDRIRFGSVVDFIDWYVRTWHWPTFNIADSAITVGVGLLAIDMLFGGSTKSQEPEPK
ncbi:MAG: signal peptidase II [Nitrospiraceae bacterium]|nr:signal peptidase II [Nitrospiraceae bacterium]